MGEGTNVEGEHPVGRLVAVFPVRVDGGFGQGGGSEGGEGMLE